LERDLSDRGTCALAVRVFNGSSLYNLRFINLRYDTLSADGYQNFAGPSQSCEVVRDDVVADPDRIEVAVGEAGSGMPK
jgi:hypothetical protein